MNRRGFFQSLAAGACGAIVRPEAEDVEKFEPTRYFEGTEVWGGECLDCGGPVRFNGHNNLRTPEEDKRITIQVKATPIDGGLIWTQSS